MGDFKCEICSGNTIRISPVLKVTENSRVNWENDSTMELLSWKDAEVQTRFCKKCFHSIIFPKFKASTLYGDRGIQVRKKHFETYFPGKVYGEKDGDLSFDRYFAKMSYDFSRFRQISSFMARSIHTKFEMG